MLPLTSAMAAGSQRRTQARHARAGRREACLTLRRVAAFTSATRSACHASRVCAPMSANLTPSKGEDQDFRKAATAGDLAAMEALLRLGANVNSENNYGQRALHNASSTGQTDAVEFLLRNGAQIHAKTKAGDTALLVAARNGHPQVVDMLLKEGAVANASNADGWCEI